MARGQEAGEEAPGGHGGLQEEGRAEEDPL